MKDSMVLIYFVLRLKATVRTSAARCRSLGSSRFPSPPRRTAGINFIINDDNSKKLDRITNLTIFSMILKLSSLLGQSTLKSLMKSSSKEKSFSCPVFQNSERSGDDNYIIALDIPTEEDPEKWILRGVALLCQKPEER